MKSKFDKHNMYEIILKMPKQFRSGIESAKGVFPKKGNPSKNPGNIIVCGMGGSGMPGEILRGLKPLDVFSHKSYGLPVQAGEKSLIICISYSGNTEETLSSFSEALKRNLPIICISSGGKLEELSRKNNVPLVKLSGEKIPPRSAVAQMFSALAQIMVNYNLLSPEIIENILNLEKEIKPEEFENQGKILAEKMLGKIPMIYTTEKYKTVGSIWKKNLNETAKIMAFTNYFPELNHNEIVGFWKINEKQIEKGKVIVFVLRDLQENPLLLKQMNITKELIEKQDVEFEFINTQGKTLLEEIFSTIVLGFWTSYHLAELYEVDPTTIDLIEEFKKRLSQNN